MIKHSSDKKNFINTESGIYKFYTAFTDNTYLHKQNQSKLLIKISVS